MHAELRTMNVKRILQRPARTVNGLSSAATLPIASAGVLGAAALVL
jgi:hypothetical protein